MDPLPVPSLDSPGATADSVKSDDSSPHHDPGRGSPPPNCAICLGTCRNKSFTDSCLHQFCFKCLLTWSKVKAECPLCKQNFRSIIHNVRSNHQYEEYMVEQSHPEDLSDIITDIDNLNAPRRYRFRTTLTLPRQNTFAIQQLLLQTYPVVAGLFPGPHSPRRRSPASFRRTVYRYNLWARPLPDFTRRFRDCSPDFYRHNTSQMCRLVPWLNRELHYLLNGNVGHIAYVVAGILELLPQYAINSVEFRNVIQRYLAGNTDHFLHELYCFASTPYDMNGYDRHVQYTTDNRVSSIVNNVVSGSESESSVDSDIVLVSSSASYVPPGPSRVARPEPAYPQSSLTGDGVIPIETISHTDSDDDSSEVMVVGYIKPPQDRTPEVVDLLGSDSDVIVQETTPPERPATRQALVKLTLARATASEGESAHTPPHSPPRPAHRAILRRKRRRRSNDSATTADTDRTTPSPQLFFFTSSEDSEEDTNTRTRSQPRRKLCPEKRRRKSRRRTRKQLKLNTTPATDSSADRDTAASDRGAQGKHKSDSGKGVKSSKKSTTAEHESARTQSIDQPGTSGISFSVNDMAYNILNGKCDKVSRSYAGEVSPSTSGVSRESKQDSSSAPKDVSHDKSESSRKHEAVRDNSEAFRNRSEAMRDNSEAVRNTSEAMRDNSEAVRNRSEAMRDNSEAVRNRSETWRDKSEAVRDKCDTSRASGSRSGTKRNLEQSARRPESKRLKSVVNVIKSHFISDILSKEPAAPRENLASDSQHSDSDDDLPLNLSLMKGTRH